MAKEKCKCCVCGVPVKHTQENYEPRFNYHACNEHMKLAPVKIIKLLESC